MIDLTVLGTLKELEEEVGTMQDLEPGAEPGEEPQASDIASFGWRGTGTKRKLLDH